MAQIADSFDLARLALHSGEGRRLDLTVRIAPLTLSGEPYAVEPDAVPVRLDVSRMTHDGHALRMCFTATLTGPCFRCLESAAPSFEVDAREVDQSGGGEELESPYVADGTLDLAAWARDALALALPAQIVCREDCRGLCPECGASLNDDPEHAHEATVDSRWAKLAELRFEE